MSQDPRNSTFRDVSAFQKQMVLNNNQPNTPEEIEAAHRYLDNHAPSLIGMILGGVL